MPGPDQLHGAPAVDPDAPGRPAHRDARPLLCVLLGGAVGAPLRYALSLALPTARGALPVATLVTNLVGALLLGVLLELLAGGPDEGTRRLLRLGLGTGLLGAFTTYSTLAVEVRLLARDGHRALAAGYAAGSAAAGLLAAAAGIAAVAAVRAVRPG